MELILMRTAGLVRRGWRATVLLAVLAGLTGGIAMAMVAAGRRTATVYDRFLRFADVPELLANFCPPGAGIEGEGDLEQCYVYDPVSEQQVVDGLPEVDQAARGVFRGLTVAPIEDPSRTIVASSLVMLDPGVASQAGRYLIVDGRDGTGRDEIVVNEALAERSGLGVGDDVSLTFWAPDELGSYGADGSTYDGLATDARIVGVARGLLDLASTQVGFSSGGGSPVAYAGPAFGAGTSDAAGFSGILIKAGDDDAQAAEAAVKRAFPDSEINLAPALGAAETAPTREAIRYEAQAIGLVGLVVAAAACLFIGQAVARQSRREWSDGPVLRAVGVTTREAGLSAALRGVAIGLPAGAVALAVAALLSPLGPIGVGRAAETEGGIALDSLVLSVGVASVIGVVVLAAWMPLARGRALELSAPPPPRPRSRRTPTLPPAVSAGLHLARSSGRASGLPVGTAIGGVAAAIATGMAAVVLGASLDDLYRTPARYGAPWDLSVGASISDPTAIERALDDADVRSAVDAAALITGADLRVGDEVVWVHAFAPLPGIERTIPVPIASGRAPATTEEIALGSITLDDLDLSLGDTVEVTSFTRGDTFEMTVVGTTIVNDNFEASPGRGAAVTEGFIDQAAPEVGGDPAVLSLGPGADVAEVAATLREVTEAPVVEPLRQSAIRNVGRIRGLPLVVAAVIGLLALASLTHALLLSTRLNRRQLGMLKALGFTRRQVATTVAVEATSFALLATAVGLPLGVIIGRWGWRLVAEGLGVPAVPIVPLLLIVGVVVAALFVANLAGAYPAWRAARLPTAVALRSE